MSHSRRFVTPMVSVNGTKYYIAVWCNGMISVNIHGVTFYDMSIEEGEYLHQNW